MEDKSFEGKRALVTGAGKGTFVILSMNEKAFTMF